MSEFVTVSVQGSPVHSPSHHPLSLGVPQDPLAGHRSHTPRPNLHDPNPFGVQVLGEATITTPLEPSTTFTQHGDVLLYKPFFKHTEDEEEDYGMSDLKLDAREAAEAGGRHEDVARLPGSLPGHEAAIPLYLERAGPRDKLFFNPKKVTAGIVTCGGLCPGLNNVIRALVNSLYYRYGVHRVLGFMYGYEGLNPEAGAPPMDLTPSHVKDIHRFGGSMLKSSRGPQDPNVMVDYLVKLGVDVLFTIGGDGTQKCAHLIAQESSRRGLAMAVVGIPKTIDNDIAYCAKTFGFETAVEMSLAPITAAHEEARSARGGIGIVKLMGRDSGFIALHAALASGDVNLLLIPEVPFSLDRVCALVEDRLRTRDHCLIVVAEGAGQDVIAAFTHAQGGVKERDASGNAKLQDIGVFLKDQLAAYLKKKKVEHTIKYIDPSYTIRSAPACGTDAVFTVSLAQQAVHAAMAGKTDCVIGLVQDEFVLIPISKAVERRKKVDPRSMQYQTVLDLTGMPRDLTN